MALSQINVIDRHELAIAQHRRVMEEQARIALIAKQARNRAATTPVFGDARRSNSLRERVIWSNS